MLKKLKDYVQYSSVTITLTLNPFHWRFRPKVVSLPEYADEEWIYGDGYRGIKIEVLFLKIVAELDDGYPDALF